MSPDEGLARQIEMYRQMTGEQRLKIALDMHEFACNISLEGIRHQFPGASEEEVEGHLRRRIELGRFPDQRLAPDGAYQIPAPF